jgi:multiple sugar transport system ATP-binding protein
MSEIRFERTTVIYPGAEEPAVDDLDLDIADGELMVLVGPSGSGKSTALRALAGLEEVYAGAVYIDGQDVTDDQPKDRDVAMVFQNYALYPYLNVADNIGFPLKMAKISKTERAERVREAAEMLELTELLDRKPAQLSGGQRQRVAMGRAIVRQPKAFLMDEPLSNLDAQLRVAMRADISALQRRLGVTTVYVTHDQVEAMTMGERVAVLRDGRLQQCGEPRELYDQPCNRFVAGFIGSPAMNLCVTALDPDGRADLDGVSVELGPEAAAAAAAGLREIVVGLRPEALEPAADGIGTLVEVVEELGSDAYAVCIADLPDGETKFTVRVDPWRAPTPGERLSLRPRRGEGHAFHPDTGDRIGPWDDATEERT